MGPPLAHPKSQEVTSKRYTIIEIHMDFVMLRMAVVMDFLILWIVVGMEFVMLHAWL